MFFAKINASSLVKLGIWNFKYRVERICWTQWSEFLYQPQVHSQGHQVIVSLCHAGCVATAGWYILKMNLCCIYQAVGNPHTNMFFWDNRWTTASLLVTMFVIPCQLFTSSLAIAEYSEPLSHQNPSGMATGSNFAVLCWEKKKNKKKLQKTTPIQQDSKKILETA